MSKAEDPRLFINKKEQNLKQLIDKIPNSEILALKSLPDPNSNVVTAVRSMLLLLGELRQQKNREPIAGQKFLEKLFFICG